MIRSYLNEDFRRANQAAISREYNAEISGSAGFVLFDSAIRRRYGIDDAARIVVVNTGNGHSNYSR